MAAQMSLDTAENTSLERYWHITQHLLFIWLLKSAFLLHWNIFWIFRRLGVDKREDDEIIFCTAFLLLNIEYQVTLGHPVHIYRFQLWFLYPHT